MRKRGARPQGKVTISWSPAFAYAIGLIASDGCLSSNGRHIIFVSKDKAQVTNFARALAIKNVISRDSTQAYRIQFGDVLFYRFLLGIGLMPNKSKVLRSVNIPPKYFFDFLRGVFDGDGSTYSYWDKRWKSSFVFYVCFASASLAFLDWMRSVVEEELHIVGHVTRAKKHTTVQLKYGKREGTVLLRRMYASEEAFCLRRKRLKIERMLRIVGERL